MKKSTWSIAAVIGAVLLFSGVATASAAEFHSSEEGLELSGFSNDGVSLEFQDSEISCEIMGLGGETRGDSEFVEVHPHLEDCTSNALADYQPTVTSAGCVFKFYADGSADLKSCANGGIRFEWKESIFLVCTIVFPNQTDMSGVAYTNTEEPKVIFDQEMSMTGDVTVSKGFCPYGLEEGAPATFTGSSDVEAWGANYFWVG